MKFSVIFIKIKTLVLTGIMLIISSLLIFTLLNNKYSEDLGPTVPTMARPQGEQTVKKDLNGDGKEDVLYITSKNNKYYVEAQINNTTYFFDEKKPINSLGNYYDFWPMTINIIDINRDKIPEIIIQSSKDNTPIQHIFIWTGTEFNDIFCSTNNIIGIIDSANNKTPKFLSLSINSNESEIQQYMLIGKTLKNISYEGYTPPGLNSVIQFIDLICYPYEITETPDIFIPGINPNDLSILWQLDKENYSYALQDGFFRDDGWNDTGSLNSCTWTINFKKYHKNSKDDTSQISFKISLDKISDSYLIKSINIFTKK